MFFLQDARVYRLLTGLFFEGVSTGLFMMALPWLMLKQGDNGTLVALIALVCTLASFLLTPIFSTAIDRFSRKYVLVCVQLAQALTALLLMLASLDGEVSTLMMASAQLIYWVTVDLTWNCTGAFIQENFVEEEYPRISSYQEVLMQGVMLLSGALGVFLLELWPIHYFALFACLAASMGAISYALMPYRRKLRHYHQRRFIKQLTESKTLFLRQPKLMLFLAMSCLSYPVLMYLVKLVPIFLADKGFSGEWFALWKSSYGFGAMMCGLAVVMLMTRFSHEKLMLSAIFTIAFVLSIMTLAPLPWVLVVMTLLIGFFNALNRIARINKMNLVIDTNERGRIDGGLKMFSTLSQSLGYVVIAFLAHWQITEWGFAVIAIVMFCAGISMQRYITASDIAVQEPLRCND